MLRCVEFVELVRRRLGGGGHVAAGVSRPVARANQGRCVRAPVTFVPSDRSQLLCSDEARPQP